MKNMYFDHAATTAVDEEVLKEMMPYFIDRFGNASALYRIGKESKDVIENARVRIAQILNVKPNEIYFTSGGTESDNLIIKGIALANKRKGNHIITSRIEHPAVLNTCNFLENMGFRVTYLDVDKKGFIDLEQLERSINRNTILISIMFANNEIGTIEPIKEIAEIANRYGVYFHTDAVQAFGNIELDVKALDIGALSLSAHKFYGPKGIGIAYIREDIPFIRMEDGGHQEREKRSGTENVPGIVGMAKAVEISNANFNEYNRKLKYLRDYYFWQVENTIPDIKINGDKKMRLPGNANICFTGVDGKELLLELDKRGICASGGSACSSGLISPSHVLLAIGVPKNLAGSSLRVTFGKENRVEDVEYLVNSLQEIVKRLRN